MNGPYSPVPFDESPLLWIEGSIDVFAIIFFVLVLCSPAIALAAYIVRRKFELKKYFVRIGSFLFIAAPVGGFFVVLWYCLIWGRFYVSFDIDDDDFNPIIPITHSVLNEEHGKMLIGSFHQLQLIWFVFAAATWVLTFCLYRFILKFTRTKSAPASQMPHSASPAT